MSHQLAFTPAAPDAQSGDLVYTEQSSRSRGLNVLMQDASPRAGGARVHFLRACYRHTVSQYLVVDRPARAQVFLRQCVTAFDAMARAVDTRLDDFEELGVFVVVRDPACLYVLCARGASARVRWRGVFVPLSTPQLGGVTEVPIETARSQHDLFAQTLPETLALYRIEQEAGTPGPREILLGGTPQDMAAAVDMVDQPRRAELERIPSDRIRHTVLLLSMDAPASVDETASSAAGRSPRLSAPRARALAGVVGGLVLVAAGIAGVNAWRDSVEDGGKPTVEETALKETPTPPPPQKRVIPDSVPDEKPEETTARGFASVWEHSFRGAVTSSPIIAGDAVVFGARDGRVYSIDRTSGEKQWAYAASGGVGASPVLKNGNVIAADYAGNVVKLRGTNGGVIWKRALREKIVSTPAVTAERVVAGTTSGRVYAISLDSGRVLWKFTTRGQIRGAIAHAGDKFLVPSNDGRLYALVEDTGAKRWSVALGGAVTSSPASDGDMVVIGTARGDVIALDLGTGKQRWSYRTGGAVNSALLIADGKVYAGAADRRLYCIEGGKLVWRFDTQGAILSRPFVGDGRVVVTSYDGGVYCLEEATGKLIDRYETHESIFSSPTVVDGRVFFGNNAGRFYCLDAPRS